MTGTAVLHMLLGGALVGVGVVVGVVAVGLADKIRGRRGTPEEPRGRGRAARAQPPVVPVHAVAGSLRTAVTALSSRARTKTPTSIDARDEAADLVTAALVASGYTKQTAAEATWACGPAERESVEAWTRAALRRCAAATRLS